MTRFDAVLFDLDGTLLDSVALILESYRHTLAHHGLPERPEAEILAGLGTTLEDQFRRWVEDEVSVGALIDTYIEHNLAVHDEYVRAYPGVSELVRALHGAGTPLAIVTSKRRRGTELGVAALGLTECFRMWVCADDVQNPKPHPEPVHMALEALGVDAARTAFVGDATHDLHAGNAAGVTTVAVTWGAAPEDALIAAEPNALVRDADALRAALT
ncbi:MAG: HAD family hydrolase [Sandaracinaceae bacterium]